MAARGAVGRSVIFFSEDNVTANFLISNFQAVLFRLDANTGKLVSPAPFSAVERTEREEDGRVAGLQNLRTDDK